MTVVRRRPAVPAGVETPADRNSDRRFQVVAVGDGFVDAHAAAGRTPVGEPYDRELLEALAVAVYTTDTEGRITFYNEAAAEFWGRRPELGELWCGSLRLFWSNGTPMPHDECPMATAVREGREVRGAQGIAERPDGTFVHFVPYPTPLRDRDGRQVGTINVVVDVTERVLAERAVLAAAEALRASNAVKDEFLGLVSHELRTPVTTIYGNARLLTDERRKLGEDARQAMLDDIAVDAERLLVVVENLLLLTRLGAGAEIDLEPQVLAHVVRTTVDGFARRHQGREVTVAFERRHLVVDADRTYLTLLLENFLSNADKYSPPDAPIEVEVSGTGDQACVVVLDRGIGISEADAERVFTPFYRAEAAKAQANGLGIGLAVCKRLVDVQGGTIWARPRAGGGSEFGFALPLSPEG